MTYDGMDWKGKFMNTEELLKQSIEIQKKTLKTQQIIIGILLILIAGIVVGGIVIFPKISAMVSHMQTLIDELQPTIDGFNQFDYETLNTTLSELKDAISSMNRFLSVFR